MYCTYYAKIFSNWNRIELQTCESKSNRIVKFVSIPSPSSNALTMEVYGA